MPKFSIGRQATQGLARGSTKIAELAGAELLTAKAAERAAAVLPDEQVVAERFLLELEVVPPDSAHDVGLRAARAPAGQTFCLGQEEFCRAVARLAWRRPSDPPFFLFRPARTLLCSRRPPVTIAQSRKVECVSSVVLHWEKIPEVRTVGQERLRSTPLRFSGCVQMKGGNSHALMRMSVPENRAPAEPDL